MPRTETQQKAMNLVESIRQCGRAAVEDLKQLCRDRGVEDDLCFTVDYKDHHLAIAQEVWNRWHTIKNFKVGDKVYVVPLTHTLMKSCIRATVTEVNDDGWGYRLRAFESDLPGIYMFNMWDKDLQPRVGKKNKPTPPELLI
jgi:hypothetical protein